MLVAQAQTKATQIITRQDIRVETKKNLYLLVRILSK
jgi:hypothetical protein